MHVHDMCEGGDLYDVLPVDSGEGEPPIVGAIAYHAFGKSSLAGWLWIMQPHKWDHLGRTGKRLYAVVGGQRLEAGQVSCWRRHISERLRFPFKAFVEYVDEVDDPDLLRELPHIEHIEEDETVTVLNLGDWDSVWGLMAAIEYRGRTYDFPLCDLRARLFSPAKRMLGDYR